jgi:DNA-binding transcriptional MerR regulator
MRALASANRPLLCGEMARLAGVSADTLRYYERCRLLPAVPRSAAGYRLFPPEALARVRLIRNAQSVGFSVNELSGIFRERSEGGVPCHRVRKLAAAKLAALQARIRDLQSRQRELRKTLAEWDRMLSNTPRGKHARLLETFAATHSKNRPRESALQALAGKNRKKDKPR